MKIDFATLAFGYIVESGGNTPNWATALGQGKDHKINEDPEIDKILKGMIYSGVPVAKVKTKIGKGGAMASGADQDSPISLAAVFSKVFVNDTLVDGGRFILLVTKDQSGVHAGRFKLKYGPSNTYTNGSDVFTNQDFFNKVKRQLGLDDDACWFVSDIDIVEQNKLVLSMVIVKENGSVKYKDGPSLHAAWSALATFSTPYAGGTTEPTQNDEVDLDKICELKNKEFILACLDVLKNKNLLSETIIDILCNKELSYSTIGFPSYSILMPVDFTKSYTEQCYISGNNRYYPEQYQIGDALYYVTNNWYPDYREKFLTWVAGLLAQPIEEPKPIKMGENIILYGVPGCGKSHKIKTEYCDNELFMKRVVFHPDYTYSDFVGQILPENIDGHISYPFVPGPFTKILKSAVNDPKHNYYLVIEELNRGNAPAIFGEVFQLLDRIDGISEYGINNADIAEAVYGDPMQSIVIPKNLFILATMNTADQNVFTLDTAFKRRWKMRSITNDIDGCFFSGRPICGSDISWKSFLKTINEKIIDLGQGSIGSEDKRLGAYFVQPNELADIDVFSEKVLMYLWNDAFKYEHDKVFRSQYKTLEQLIDGFKSILFEVFDSNIQFEKIKVETTADASDDITEITPEQYLQGKSEKSKSIYNNMLNEINDVGIEYTIGAVKNYLSIKTPNGKIAAELHLQSDKVKVLIKEPQNDEYKIGITLPDTYRWSKNYEIIADDGSDIGLIVSAIIDSYDQVNG